VGGEELPLPAFHLGERRGEVRFGERPRFHAGAHVLLLSLGESDGGHPRVHGLAGRDERPVGALDRGGDVGGDSAERGRRAAPVDPRDAERGAGGIGGAVAQERLPELQAEELVQAGERIEKTLSVFSRANVDVSVSEPPVGRS
jgi:hypothetical protein